MSVVSINGTVVWYAAICRDRSVVLIEIWVSYCGYLHSQIVLCQFSRYCDSQALMLGAEGEKRGCALISLPSLKDPGVCDMNHCGSRTVQIRWTLLVGRAKLILVAYNTNSLSPALGDMSWNVLGFCWVTTRHGGDFILKGVSTEYWNADSFFPRLTCGFWGHDTFRIKCYNPGVPG